MNAGHNAVLFEFTNGRHAAIGLHEVAELVMSPRLVNVPLAPDYCHSLCIWQDRAIPFVELAPLIGQRTLKKISLALVVTYFAQSNGEQRWGALGLSTYFRMMSVSDDAACLLPQDSPAWPSIAHSCFQLVDENVPILNLNALFEQRLQLIP
ncbi:CheW-like domain-containing protein [Candidatus Nitrotoga sp. HW29]|uniref:chemotaxis protein CheW n=1 Tax=Candidatus Nitrotoga sp. HW29 TaxID=2886963 RepID=UPI001EF353B7|nr:chemotaxis protein CheW [Candidatus Nitrotoga sp. HW29]CAH1903817.1 CheW-like domain-containing protein [Candidatus Nitrotoga sp. HW29]